MGWGGSVGLSWGRGVGILAKDEEEDGEQRTSEDDVTDEVQGAEEMGGPPGEGALRRMSGIGVPQDSGVSSCTPPMHSALPSPPTPCPGL